MNDAANQPLPMSIDEITPAWLTAALRASAPDATVHGAEIVDVRNGACTKIRIRLDLNEAGRAAGIPEQIILKGGFELHSRDKALLHDREVRGYRHVLPVLELPSPACYFADYRADQQQGIVIMEDLTLRNVDFCDALRPQSFEQVRDRLTAFARFHARTWASTEFETGRWAWVEDGMPRHRANFERRYFEPETWKKITSLPRSAASSVQFQRLDWARHALDKLVKLSARLPHVILHGDAHLGNMYVEPDGSPGFYDPMTHRDHAMRDVAYHMGGAIDSADRRRWEGVLLQHYLDELQRNGVEAPPYEEARRIYAAYLAIGYLLFLVNDTQYQPEAINTANTARFSIAMIENDTDDILNSI